MEHIHNEVKVLRGMQAIWYFPSTSLTEVTLTRVPYSIILGHCDL